MIQKQVQGKAYKHYIAQGAKGPYVVVNFKCDDNGAVIDAAWFGTLGLTVNPGKKKSAGDVTFETLIALGFEGDSLQSLNVAGQFVLADLVVDLIVEQDDKGRWKVASIRTGQMQADPVDTSSVDMAWKAKLAAMRPNRAPF